MNKFAALILGSALTALIASTALAASTTPPDPGTAKPAAATSAPAAAAPATAMPAATAAAEPATGAKEQTPKIGYVDMLQIASETDSGKASTATLKAKSGKLSAKIEAKQKQLEKQKTAIEAKIESFSAKERAAKAKEFQKKVEEYQKLVRSSDQEMQELQEKLTNDLYKAIKAAATEYGKSHGYAAVLAKKDILYLADSPEPKDLTEEISALLDKKPKSK
jgi:outer membrane protein